MHWLGSRAWVKVRFIVLWRRSSVPTFILRQIRGVMSRAIIAPAKQSLRRCRRSVPMIHERAAEIAAGCGRGEMLNYWAVARLQPQHERAGLINLGLNGYEVYYPRVRERRIRQGRRIEVRPPLFWGYAFFVVKSEIWYSARWSIGVLGVIMDGVKPARVPDAVIAEIKGRERGGAVMLPERERFKPGEPVRVVVGPFAGRLGLYSGMRPRERIEVLLQLLGSLQKVELAQDAIEAADRGD
jgi:transcriptional antiterminator RfaH